ncbi:MAG TPA: hypothetical protein VK826_14780 [Bacteroidia bacterium]|nr:hypothetical protein [Bacteroidia bacterium]
MKRILAAMILVPAIVGAQNLVTNATMEQTSWAAFRPGIEKAQGWSNSNGGTADLFKPSRYARKDGIPQNYMGTQDGGGGNYAGIIAYYGDQSIDPVRSVRNGVFANEIGYGRYTEYLQGELSEPLVKGRLYTFSFQVSLAEESDRAVRGLGAYFSTEKLNMRGNSFLQLSPQVVSKEVITDMNGWTEIRGMFIAEGGERYFSIGAFPEHLTVADLSDPNRNDSRKAYYYVARPSLTAGPVLNEPVTQRSISTAAETFDKQGLVYLGINFATGSAYESVKNRRIELYRVE